MSCRMKALGFQVALAVVLCVSTAPAASILNENFNTVTGTGGGPVLVGSGFNWVTSWDTGITGEQAFGGTTGNASVGAISAFGSTNGGVGNTGAGVIDVTGVGFNLRDENFDSVTGTGGGIFLAGDGTPDTSGYVLDWDSGIAGEAAFAGTFGGAAIQTGGGASVQGVTTGGVSGTGAGQIAMSGVDVTSGNWYAGLQWDIGPFPEASPFYNPGFESGFSHWTPSGNAYAITGASIGTTAHGGTYLLKMFGNFTGGYNQSLAYQTVPALPGQVWSLSAFVQHLAADSITGTQNHVDIAIEFRDPNGVLLDSIVQTVLDGSSPTDTWLAAGPIQLTAPANTATARAVMLFVQPAVGLYEGGAGDVDDVVFKIVGGPTSVDLSEHSLTASLLGAANTGAGQVLGDYQLRIEDTEGSRLLFRGLTNGGWQSIGGALSTAIEADSSGTPTPGAFNVNSLSFRLVVAFDDEYTHRWGTGGTLNVDNLRLTSAIATGSGWYAGLDWPDLSIPAPIDLADVSVNASVLGNVVGGKYLLRVEAMQSVSTGLDESFNTVTGDCGTAPNCRVVEPNDITGPDFFRFVDDWDTGIQDEGAYGGVYGGTYFLAGGGIYVRGLPTGGTSGTGAGQIYVQDVILGPSGGWYAGINWPNEHLASTDLSQVTLQASIKGEALSGGSLGPYELRIEDTDGDRLYFPMTATGDWQTVGGPLSTATFGTSLGGTSNGVFDLDSAAFAVVVSFREEPTIWGFGGSLTVDNLYMTPVVTQNQLGNIAFHGVADGDWQSIGGPLSTGESSFNNLNESFNGVTGVGGGEFWASGGGQTFGGTPWDTGITGEETFAGTWGSGTLATENAWGCLTCGVNGTGAGNVSVTGAGGGASGGWWAGLTWVVSPPDWSTLANVLCTAKVKASKLAPFMLRVEDGSKPAANPTWLGFTHTPTTLDFEAVGGPLSTAVQGCPNPPCAAFSYNATYYRVTLIFSGGTADTTWGAEGQLTVDDLFFTGIGFDDADFYTVTLAFEDEVATWGTAGQLKIDNLSLQQGPAVCKGDTNCDGTISYADINPFVRAISSESLWKTTFPGSIPPTGCTYLGVCDINSSGGVDYGDINPFVIRLQSPGPCP